MSPQAREPCPEQETLANFLAETLADAEILKLQSHLAACAGCRTELEQMVELHPPPKLDWLPGAGVADLPAEAPDSERAEALERRIQSELRQPEREVSVESRFVRIQPVGRGGLGEVYRYRDELLERDVALKFIRSSAVDDPLGNLMFERECKITSALNHPAIVAMHGRGVCAEGRPFYVMSYLEGSTLRSRIQGFHASSDTRPRRDNEAFRALLDSLIVACGAIQHAHDRGVCHRDVKPDNIVVRDDGVTVVVDWGLARRKSAAAEDNGPVGFESPRRTSSDALGTLAYMAPEQAAGDGRRVNHLTDVYGLGAVLFEILTNAPPHRMASSSPSSKMDRRPIDDQSRVQRLRRTVSAGPAPRPRDGNPSVPAELDSICRRAMATDPADRYPNAQAIADDIERWLVDAPVHAHRYTVAQHVHRNLRRRAGMLATVAFALAAVVVVAGFALALTGQSRDAERAARLRAQDLLEREEIQRVQIRGQLSKYALDNRDLINVRPDVNSPHASWPDHFLQVAGSHGPLLADVLGDGYCGMLAMDISPDTRQLVCGDASGRLTLWDVQSGSLLRVLESGRFDAQQRRGLHYFDRATPATSSDDEPICACGIHWLGASRQIVLASLDGTGLLIDVDTGQRVVLLKHSTPLTAVASSEDDARLLFGDQQGALRLCSRDGEVIAESPANDDPITVLTRLPDGGWLVGRESGTLEVRGNRLEILEGSSLPSPIWSADVSTHPAGIRVAVAAGESMIRVFDLADESPRLRLKYPLRAPLSQQRRVEYHMLRFSRDGTVIHAVDSSGVAAAWNVEEQRLLWTRSAVSRNHAQAAMLAEQTEKKRPPLVLRRRCSAIQTSADSRLLLVAGEDQAVGAWLLPATDENGRHVAPRVAGGNPAVAFDDRRAGVLWTRDPRGTLRVVSAVDGAVLARSRSAHAAERSNLAILASRAVTAGSDGRVRFWKQTGEVITADSQRPLVHDRPLLAVAVDPQRQYVAATDIDGCVLIWRLEDGRRVYQNRVVGGQDKAPLTGKLAFSPDGHYLAAFGCDVSANVFQLERKPESFRKLPLQSLVGGRGGTAMLWNPVHPSQLLGADDHPRIFQHWVEPPLAEWNSVHHPGEVTTSMAATRDAKRLAVLETDGVIRFLDSQYGYEMLRLQSALSPAVDIAFDVSGRWMAIADNDGNVEFWDAVGRDQPSRPPPRDESSDWQRTTLGPPSRDLVQSAARCVTIDSVDRVVVLAVHRKTDHSREGQLYFYGGDLPTTGRELVARNDGYDDRVPFNGAAVTLTSKDEPLVVMRRRLGELDPYDGQLCSARRQGPGDWRFETLQEHGNAGFYPLPVLDKSDQLSDVFHFTFAGYYLQHAHHDSNGPWRSDTVGRQGDGMDLLGRQDAQGHIHCVFQTNRMNSGSRALVYGARAPGQVEPSWEIVSNTLGGAPICLSFLPDGSPVVARRILDRRQRRSRLHLMRRSDDGWERHQVLPDVESWSIHPDISPDGTTYFVSYDKERRALALWTGRGDAWSEVLIAKDLPTDAWENPSEAYLRFDRAGHPVVVLLIQTNSRSQFHIVRRK